MLIHTADGVKECNHCEDCVAEMEEEFIKKQIEEDEEI